jgi:hypothetical protein
MRQRSNVAVDRFLLLDHAASILHQLVLLFSHFDIGQLILTKLPNVMRLLRMVHLGVSE